VSGRVLQLVQWVNTSVVVQLTISTATSTRRQAYEVDKQQRFERARLEREAAEARKKHQEELKKKAAALREVRALAFYVP